MKLLIAIFLMHMSTVAMAGPTEAITEGKYQPGECFDSLMFEYMLVEKLDDTHYALTSRFNTPAFSGYGILEINNGGFNKPGRLHVRIEHTGVKAMRMKNGFTRNVDMWKVCQ